MPLTVVDCQVTVSSITLVFSDPVDPPSATNPANYSVFDPSANAAALQVLTQLTAVMLTPAGIANVPATPNVVVIPFLVPAAPGLPPFNLGDWVTVKVSGVNAAPGSGIAGIGVPGQAIGAAVNGKHALRIADCVASPSSVVVYFSEPLDIPNPAGNPANNPNLPNNYTVALQPPGPAITVANATYDPAKKATYLQLSGNIPQRGQWVTVKALTVTSGGIAISNNGKDTFFVRVNGEQRADGDDEILEEAGLRQARAAEEGVAYPMMTEDVGLPPSSSYGTTGGGGGATGGTGGSGRISAGPAATQAISQVLGWKLNDNDPAAFVGALTQSFTLTEVDGHTQATWTPRSYTVQTDLAGGITGAQASMYARAQEALDQSVPLLNGLYALNPDADQEMIDALKDIIQSQFTELVNELGTLGGPRQFRVNQYFHLLIDLQAQGSQPPTLSSGTEPDTIKGNLGRLRDELSVTSTSKFINTIDDEQDMTNFRILSDYLTSLAQTWINNYQFFGLDTKQPFLGTQLVLLSRQLSVISDTVNEVRFTLDSVFISQAERQTLQLEFTSGDPALFVEDLLQISQDFSQVEGPQLIQNAGKLGVGDGFLPVVRNLRRLVHEARNPANAHKLPDGFRTIRVRNAFDDLHDQFFELERMAAGVSRKTPPRPFQGGRARPKKI